MDNVMASESLYNFDNDIDEKSRKKCVKYLLAYPENIRSYLITHDNRLNDDELLMVIDKFMNYAEDNRVEMADYIICHKNLGRLEYAKPSIINNLKNNGPYSFLCMIDGYTLTYDDAEKICMNTTQLSRSLRSKISDDNFKFIIDYIFDNHMEKYLCSDNLRLLSAPVFYGDGIKEQKDYLFSHMLKSGEPIIVYWLANMQNGKVPTGFYRKYFNEHKDEIMSTHRDDNWGRFVKVILPMFESGKLDDEVRTIVLNNYESTGVKLQKKLLKYTRGDECYNELYSHFTSLSVLKTLKSN